MESLLGKINKGTVTDENDDFYFVQLDDHKTYRLAKKEVKKPLKNGSQFTGFAYENKDHDAQITREAPEIRVGRYGWATVVQSRRDLGVFVDIGLPNKDMVVSLDQLPTEKKLWPNTGDKLLVSIVVDNKERMWANLADEPVYRAISHPAQSILMNKNIKVIAYRLKLAGTLVISESGNHLGFIHPSERSREPRLGELLDARIIKIQQDGTMNLSLRPRAYEAIGEDAAMLLAVLEHQNDQTLTLNDHSDPSDIKAALGISKGQFKRALGHLLKSGVVEKTDDGIKLRNN